MNVEGVARNLPLLTAGVLFALVAVLLARRRFGTLTERLFTITLFLAGAYALCDFLYFRASSAEQAIVEFQLEITALNFAALFIVLFTVSFRHRPNRRWLYMVPGPVFFFFLIWTWMVHGVEQTAWGWMVTVRNEFLFPWAAYTFLYLLAGTVHIYMAYRSLKGKSRALALRTLALMLSFVFYMAAGVSLLAILGASGPQSTPVFSVLLLVPGATTIPMIFPVTWDKWVAAVRSQEHRRRHEVLAVNLMYEDGTLIGSKSMLASAGFDLEMLSKTLNLIQSFVRKSFPGLSGGSLRALDHEGLRILVEKGEHSYLALILSGRENDLLRTQMKHAINSFESRNDWTALDGFSFVREPKGASKTLDMFFAKESLF